MLRTHSFLTFVALFAISSTALADHLQVSRAAPVRDNPSSTAQMVFTATVGANLQLLESDKTNGYYHVQNPESGQTGWIYKTWVRRFPGDALSAGPGPSPAATTDLHGSFPVVRCKAPYNESPQTGLDIESCGLAGDAKTDSGEEAQNPVKNDLCQSGIAQVITVDDLSELQKAVEASGMTFGRNNVPKDRSPLHSLPPLSKGAQLQEGSLVTFVGFLAEEHYMPKSESKPKKGKGGESVNCHTVQHEGADIHLAFATKPGRIKMTNNPTKNASLCKTISGEMIPHLRPEVWNNDTLDQVIDLARPIRVTGQLFFDASHRPCEGSTPGQGDPARLTSWEIHPIYTFEVCKFDTLQKCDASKQSNWQPLSKTQGVNVNDEEEDN